VDDPEDSSEDESQLEIVIGQDGTATLWSGERLFDLSGVTPGGYAVLLPETDRTVLTLDDGDPLPLTLTYSGMSTDVLVAVQFVNGVLSTVSVDEGLQGRLRISVVHAPRRASMEVSRISPTRFGIEIKDLENVDNVIEVVVPWEVQTCSVGITFPESLPVGESMQTSWIPEESETALATMPADAFSISTWGLGERPILLISRGFETGMNEEGETAYRLLRYSRSTRRLEFPGINDLGASLPQEATGSFGVDVALGRCWASLDQTGTFVIRHVTHTMSAEIVEIDATDVTLSPHRSLCGLGSVLTLLFAPLTCTLRHLVSSKRLPRK